LQLDTLLEQKEIKTYLGNEFLKLETCNGDFFFSLFSGKCKEKVEGTRKLVRL
jgi:hypothetical protein